MLCMSLSLSLCVYECVFVNASVFGDWNMRMRHNLSVEICIHIFQWRGNQSASGDKNKQTTYIHTARCVDDPAVAKSNKGRKTITQQVFFLFMHPFYCGTMNAIVWVIGCAVLPSGLLCNWTYVHCLYCTRRSSSSSSSSSTPLSLLLLSTGCVYMRTTMIHDLCVITVWVWLGRLARAVCVCGITNCYGVHFVSIYAAPVCLFCKYYVRVYLYRLNSYRLASGWSKVKELSVKCIASQCDKPLFEPAIRWSGAMNGFLCVSCFVELISLPLIRLSTQINRIRPNQGSQTHIKLNQSVSRVKMKSNWKWWTHKWKKTLNKLKSLNHRN